MPIQGLRSSEDFGVTGWRPENWREMLLLLEPNGDAPFTALTAAMATRVVDDPYFHWFEKRAQVRRLELTANLAASTQGATTVATVADGARGFIIGALFRVEETGEVMRVNAAPTIETSISFERGFAGSDPTSLVDFDGVGVNPNLMFIGNSIEEGSDAPEAAMFDPTEQNNRTQIFRDSLEHTRTASKTRLRTGDAVKEAKRETLQIHANGIERAMFFGRKSLTTVNNKPMHTMDGIRPVLEAYNGGSQIVQGTPGGVDLDEFEGFLEQAFRFGSDEKMGWIGNTAMLTVQRLVRKNSQYNIAFGEKEFGMNVMRFVSPFGELVLKRHKQFNQIVSGSTGGTAYDAWGSQLWITDMANLTYVHMAGDDMRFEGDNTAKGKDAMKSGYLTECSLELHFPETHFIIESMLVGAADD